MSVPSSGDNFNKFELPDGQTFFINKPVNTEYVEFNGVIYSLEKEEKPLTQQTRAILEQIASEKEGDQLMYAIKALQAGKEEVYKCKVLGEEALAPAQPPATAASSSRTVAGPVGTAQGFTPSSAAGKRCLAIRERGGGYYSNVQFGGGGHDFLSKDFVKWYQSMDWGKRERDLKPLVGKISSDVDLGEKPSGAIDDMLYRLENETKEGGERKSVFIETSSGHAFLFSCYKTLTDDNWNNKHTETVHRQLVYLSNDANPKAIVTESSRTVDSRTKRQTNETTTEVYWSTLASIMTDFRNSLPNPEENNTPTTATVVEF